MTLDGEQISMDAVLNNLGVRDDTLSSDELAQLDEKGFLYLSNMMTADQVSAFATRLEELLEIEGDDAGIEVHQERGSLRLSDLINKDPVFDYCYTHPRLLAAARHILTSNFKVHSLNSRFALPGQGNQVLHADWSDRGSEDERTFKNGEGYFVANSLWLLDEIDDVNGPSRMVPGSHRRGVFIEDVMEDRLQPYPGEVYVNAPAGTVIVFNGHMWHGGTLNRSDKLRRVMHMAFVRRHLPQQTNQAEYLRPETAGRLSPEMRVLLNV